MPNKKHQTQQSIDNNSIDQLEIAAADTGFSLFCKDKKLTEPTYIQICVLKNFFEIYKSSIGYECKDQIDIEGFNDKLSTEYLKKIFDLSSQNETKVQDLIKIDQQDLITVVVLIKLQALISNLDNKKNYDSTCKKIFSLMDRLLPYYRINLRDAFYLDSLFSGIEKNRVIFFKNLNGILSRVPRTLLFEQIQISCLCSMLFWVSHSKSINFYLIIDALLILSKYNLENFMFNMQTLTDSDVISILPSPLRVIDILTKYYEVETTKVNEFKKLQVLNNIKNGFLELQKQNSLQMSLRREFIFFIDSALDFALTSTTKKRTFILQHYDNFRPLIRKIFLSYDSPSMSSEALLMSITILEMMDKWQVCIQVNLQAFGKSEQTGLELSEQENREIKAYNQALLAQASQAQPSKQAIQAAKQFTERKLKNAEEEALEVQKSEVAKLAQPTFIDQYQNELTKKFLTISNVKYSEQEGLFDRKEQIITKEIVKFMRLTPIEKLLDKALLKELEDSLFSLKDEIRANELHTLLLLYINLLDIFLSRINYKMQIYKKQYATPIEKMFNRHGQNDFSGADHALNKLIKQHAKLILDNLTATNGDGECILKIFDIINLLKSEIKDNEFYKIWNLPINFRKGEYKDSYNNAAANLTQFRSYLDNKSQACKKLGIQIKKNKKTISEISENEISQKLEKLMDAFYKIDKRINENDSLTYQSPKVFLTKQSQARQQEIQNTVIDSNRMRVPIDYRPSDVLRKSQSFSNLYTKPSIFSLFENSFFSANKNKKPSFFISVSKSDINIEEEKISLETSKYNRKMSV